MAALSNDARGRRPGKEEHEQQSETEIFSRSRDRNDPRGLATGFALDNGRNWKGTLPSRAYSEAQVNEAANYCSNSNYSSESSYRSTFRKPIFSWNDRRHRHCPDDNYGATHYTWRPTVEYHPYARYENTQIYRNDSWTGGTNQNCLYARNQNYYYGREVSNGGFMPMLSADDGPYARNEYVSYLRNITMSSADDGPYARYENGSYRRNITNRHYLSEQSTYESSPHARRLIDQYGSELYEMNIGARGLGAGPVRHALPDYYSYVSYPTEISTDPYVDRRRIAPYQSFRARDRTFIEARIHGEARNQNLQHCMRNSTISSGQHDLNPPQQCLDLNIDEKTCESDKFPNAVSSEQIPSSNGGIERQLMHTSCRKKLLVLDLNGLLADVTSERPLIREADTRIRRNAVFRRPFCVDFLNFCFEKFDVGIWSSRISKNVSALVDFLMGDAKDRLLFCWDQSHCTSTGFKTIENAVKPLVLKELKKLWNKEVADLPWNKGYYSPSNTLLVDDSPYKALCNPPHTAIFPSSYRYTDNDDCFLGPGGDLRVYLEGLAMCDNVQDYVQNHPFGQCAITFEDPNWNFYKNIIDKFEQTVVEPVKS